MLMRPMFFLHLCPGKWTTTLYVIICRNSIIISSKVCDNVDLKIILEEYSSYHQVKYGKRPDICRRAEKEVGSEGHSLQGNPARRRKAQRALPPRAPSPCATLWRWVLSGRRRRVAKTKNYEAELVVFATCRLPLRNFRRLPLCRLTYRAARP